MYIINRKTAANRLFMLAMIANAYWALCSFMITQSASEQTAILWNKALSFWPFMIAFLIHFALAFTESDLLKNKLTHPILYLPALGFSLIDLTTNWISVTPTLQAWGYEITYSTSIVTRLDGIWSATLGLLVLFVFISYYQRIRDVTRRKQTKFIAVGLGIPIFTSIVTDSLFRVMGIHFPVLGCISGSATAFFVVYAMLKYGLFSFRPEIAFENIFSNMPDSVILSDMNGVIVKVNPSLLELTGFREEEVIGKSMGQIIQDTKALDRENRAPQAIAQLHKQREIENYEITFSTKSGERKTAVVSCSIVSNNQGQDVGVAFVIHDVTERKEMEQKLLKAERLASIGELAGILGHDLRNPLSGIRGATYYLQRKYAGVLDSEDKAMFESIDKSINYSNKIITDLIDYSSEINLHLNRTTPKALVNAALALLVPPQNVQVIDESQEEPQLWVDKDRIIHGFMNIITNAFEAMPNGGKLIIANEKYGETIIFSFRDTGQGMNEETLRKVGVPLFTTKAKGMGFGLAICKRTVEAHAGKASAHSKLGEGTIITVELPMEHKS